MREKIIGKKKGYNPNSSSIGSILYGLPLVLVLVPVVFAFVTIPVIIFFRKRR